MLHFDLVSLDLQDMKYDLGDCTLWEYMFPTNDKPQLVLPDEDNLDDDEENVICVFLSPV